MLTCYTNDTNMTCLLNIDNIKETIHDLNGGERIIDQLEVFTVGYNCSSIDLMAATLWAREVTGIENLVGIATNSDTIYSETFNIVVYDGLGDLKQYCTTMGMEEIFDYYPVNNLTDAVTYHKEKLKAQHIIQANNSTIV